MERMDSIYYLNLLDNFVSQANKDLNSNTDALQLYKDSTWMHKPNLYNALESFVGLKKCMQFQSELAKQIVPKMLNEMNVFVSPYYEVETVKNKDGLTFHYCSAHLFMGSTDFLTLNLFNGLSAEHSNKKLKELDQQIALLNDNKKELNNRIAKINSPENNPDVLMDEGKISGWQYFKYSFNEKNFKKRKATKINNINNQIDQINEQIQNLKLDKQNIENNQVQYATEIEEIKEYCRRLNEIFYTNDELKKDSY